jgi:hypothetical protein
MPKMSEIETGESRRENGEGSFKSVGSDDKTLRPPKAVLYLLNRNCSDEVN